MSTSSSDGAVAQPAARSFGQQVLSLLKELVLVLIGAIIVSSLLRAFVGQMFIIPSESMENTLLIGDRVVVQKLTDYRRGDVVVFADPGGWLNETVEPPTPVSRALEFIGIPTKSSTGHLIKRVIGMPGDTVICCDADGRITVNGAPLREESYLYADADDERDAPSLVQFEVVVPRDRVFVMGDHRSLSADSRCHLADYSTTQSQGQVAFVPIADIVGPAFAVAAPFDRAARLHRPETFADVPGPSGPAPATGVIKPEGVTCG